MTPKEFTLGQYIGAAIDRSGRTRDAIAMAVHVTGPYLSQIRADQALPKSGLLDALIRELQLDPGITHSLAEKAAAHRLLERQTQQMQRALRDHPTMPDPVAMEHAVYESSLRPYARAAGSGIPVLVINPQKKTVGQVLVQLLGGPELDEDGNVCVRLHTGQLANLPKEFFLDVIFLFAVPSPSCLRTLHIGPQERSQLGSREGLEVRVSFPEGPGLHELLQRVRQTLLSKKNARHPLFDGILALQIRAA